MKFFFSEKGCFQGVSFLPWQVPQIEILEKHEILQRQSDLIRKWLAKTTEPFYDWDWDGEELVVFVDEVGKEKDWDENNEPPEEWWELPDLATERYSYQDLKEVIEGFK